MACRFSYTQRQEDPEAFARSLENAPQTHLGKVENPEAYAKWQRAMREAHQTIEFRYRMAELAIGRIQAQQEMVVDGFDANNLALLRWKKG